jgi:hypothetical protein
LKFLQDTSSTLLANIVSIAITGAVVYWGILPAIDKRPLQSWQYKVVSPNDLILETELAMYGVEGWEIVTARRATSKDTDTASYEMILKRKLR